MIYSVSTMNRSEPCRRGSLMPEPCHCDPVLDTADLRLAVAGADMEMLPRTPRCSLKLLQMLTLTVPHWSWV